MSTSIHSEGKYDFKNRREKTLKGYKKEKKYTWMKLEIESEKEDAASKAPPRSQNSGVEEKRKSCLVCLRW